MQQQPDGITASSPQSGAASDPVTGGVNPIRQINRMAQNSFTIEF
jgi:hypothetical protein